MAVAVGVFLLAAVAAPLHPQKPRRNDAFRAPALQISRGSAAISSRH